MTTRLPHLAHPAPAADTELYANATIDTDDRTAAVTTGFVSGIRKPGTYVNPIEGVQVVVKGHPIVFTTTDPIEVTVAPEDTVDIEIEIQPFVDARTKELATFERFTLEVDEGDAPAEGTVDIDGLVATYTCDNTVETEDSFTLIVSDDAGQEWTFTVEVTISEGV